MRFACVSSKLPESWKIFATSLALEIMSIFVLILMVSLSGRYSFIFLLVILLVMELDERFYNFWFILFIIITFKLSNFILITKYLRLLLFYIQIRHVFEWARILSLLFIFTMYHSIWCRKFIAFITFLIMNRICLWVYNCLVIFVCKYFCLSHPLYLSCLKVIKFLKNLQIIYPLNFIHLLLHSSFQ